MSESYERAKGAEEHILPLEGGRQLAYAHNGPPESRIVVLNLTGLMSVGSCPDVPDPCREAGVHWIHPTLPGMGNSSPRPSGEKYHVSFVKDMTALLDHLYPTGAFDKLFLGGGSYASVQAQMLYGASYHLFPAGRKIAGCVLLAGFAPFKYHKNYARDLTWHTWLSVGPPAHTIPFHMMQRTFSTMLASKFKTTDGVKQFLDQVLYSKMDPDEQKVMTRWLERKGRTREDFMDSSARNVQRCSKQWVGFHEVSDIIHSDWGFEPAKLDDAHGAPPLLIVGSEGDPQGGRTNGWLGDNYKNTRVKVYPGGHISSMFYMDEIWGELLQMSTESGF